MSGFVKLDCGIVDSTVWTEPHDVLRVWIALLAKCDSVGIVRSTVPALSLLCMVPVPRMVEILDRLAAPDPFSRTPDNDGRRIEPLPEGGGWLILNYVKHREITQGKPGSHADRQRRYRERLSKRDASLGVTRDETRRHCDASKVTRDTEGEGEGEEAEEARARSKERSPAGYGSEQGSDAQQPPPSPADSDPAKPIVNGHPATPPTDQDNGATDAAPHAKRCPFTDIVALYHEKLPMCPRVEKLTNIRKGYIRQRWLEDLPTLDAWRNYFTDVSNSKFLTGRAPGRDDKPPFVADLEWLTRPSNFVKVAEGKYHR